MNRKRSIQAYLLIVIYGMLLLHDVVPHSHAADEVQGDSISHKHKAHDHQHDHGTGLFDILKSLVHSHSEVADAQHHDLTYKSASVEFPFWLFVISAPVAHLHSFDIKPPTGNTNISLSLQQKQGRDVQVAHSLRAPPMS